MKQLCQSFSWNDADQYNTKLLELIRENYYRSINGGGQITETRFFLESKSEVAKLFLNWVQELIPYSAHKFSIKYNADGTRVHEYDDTEYLLSLPGTDNQEDVLGNGGELGFNPYAFKICDCWGIYYDKSQGVEKHNHFPYSLAFVYYVNTPENSSPVILNGQEVKPKAGQIIFFQGHHYHEVPSSNVDGRCIIAGLITYSPRTKSTNSFVTF